MSDVMPHQSAEVSFMTRDFVLKRFQRSEAIASLRSIGILPDRVRVFLDKEVDRMCVAFAVDLASQHGRETVDQRLVRKLVPATWGDHFKQDHAPAWFLRRFPVRLRHIEIVQQTVVSLTTIFTGIHPTADDIARGTVRVAYLGRDVTVTFGGGR
jgi:hypothetical protein